MKPELVEKLREFIDGLEEYHGDVEGFEVRLEHPIEDGQRQGYATIKEFVLHYITKEQIDIKE